MKKIDTELLVGVLVLIAIGILVYLSLQLGRVNLMGDHGYRLQAVFSTAGGLQNGAVVELAGVEIGRVAAVDLVDYQARVTLRIQPNVQLPKDTQAAIKSAGLIGERYVEITPGVATEYIPPGGKIQETEAPVDLTDIIPQFIFGSVGDSTADQEASSEDKADPWALDLD